MAAKDRLDLREVGRGRHDDAAGSHHRLYEHRGDRFRPLAQDQRLQAVGEAGGERLLALAIVGEPPMMRAFGVQDARDRQVEVTVVGRQAGEAGGRDGDAVIRALAGDDLLLFRPAERVIVVPDQLDRRVVRFRSGVGEQHLRHRRRSEADQPLGELDRRRRRLAAEGMIEGQFRHGAPARLRQSRFAEAESRAPQSSEPFDVLFAVLIVDVDALSPGDHQRSGFLVHLAGWCRGEQGRRDRAPKPSWVRWLRGPSRLLLNDRGYRDRHRIGNRRIMKGESENGIRPNAVFRGSRSPNIGAPGAVDDHLDQAMVICIGHKQPAVSVGGDPRRLTAGQLHAVAPTTVVAGQFTYLS